MAAAPKMAKVHQCRSCAETKAAAFAIDRNAPDGLSRTCRACRHAIYYSKHPGAKRFGRNVLVPLSCGYCTGGFSLKKTIVSARLKLAVRRGRDPVLYCSHSCAHFARAGKGIAGQARMIKRQEGWSDLQWAWEKQLAALGLGMGVGRSVLLCYGHGCAGADDLTDEQSQLMRDRRDFGMS